MKKSYFSVQINAPRNKVWDVMLADKTYRQWTEAFNPGSYFVGSWGEGEEIKFLGPDPEGNGEGGMLARVLTNKKYEKIVLEHFGMITNGQIDTTSDKVKTWTPALEAYTFSDQNGGTLLEIEVDLPDEYSEMFCDLWPKALEILKNLAENSASEGGEYYKK